MIPTGTLRELRVRGLKTHANGIVSGTINGLIFDVWPQGITKMVHDGSATGLVGTWHYEINVDEACQRLSLEKTDPADRVRVAYHLWKTQRKHWKECE